MTLQQAEGLVPALPEAGQEYGGKQHTAHDKTRRDRPCGRPGIRLKKLLNAVPQNGLPGIIMILSYHRTFRV